MDIEKILSASHELLSEIIIDYSTFKEKLSTYCRNDEIEKLFREVLTESEEDYLYKMLLSDEGWYVDTDTKYGTLIRLIPRLLGLSEGRLSYRYTDEEVLNYIKSIHKDAQIPIFISVYLKQKLITYKSLLNNSIDKVILFRGMKISNALELEPFKPCTNESWTADIETAKNIAMEGGYIFKKEFSIKNIFVYPGSRFIPKDIYIDKNISIIINDEKEFIIENDGSIFKPIMGENVFRSNMIDTF